MVASLAAVCVQLVQDVCDDEECYQAHFPAECRISLPAISCRSSLSADLSFTDGACDTNKHIILQLLEAVA